MRIKAPRRIVHAYAVTLMLSALTVATLGQQASSPQAGSQESFTTLKVNSELVLTNIVARDKKTGQPVKGLTRDDFLVLEDGKPQQIASFDFEDTSQAAAFAPPATAQGASGRLQLGSSLGAPEVNADQLTGHRLIILFVDTTSLQPDDLDRMQQAAKAYVNTRMEQADLVAVVSLGNTLSVDQDFTADKALLLRAIANYSPGGSQGFIPGATTTTNQVEDTSAYSADETDYNDLNTDRELLAIANIAKSLASVRQRKSLLYFSGGISRDGIENQASLRAAVNAAVRANLAIYSVDARGLQAVSPLGDATIGSLRGAAAYNGSALQNNLDANFNSQEVMATLSSDTGGKSFFDDNDLAPVFSQVQQDSATYYVIGFHSTNTLRDGRFRKLQIRVKREDVKLEYRPGYYAPADFQHSGRQDRERDLEAQLSSDLPATDVSLYLQTFYFRGTKPGQYTIPVTLLVPGSQVPFTRGGSRDKASLDVIGQVRDAHGAVVGEARDTVKLAINVEEGVSQKNIQYTTSFALPAGKYNLKFVVRENETGKMGSFVASLVVPELNKGTSGIKLSSLVLANQQAPSSGKKIENPLVFTGNPASGQLIPNLPHIFRSDQPLYFLYEVYDPAKSGANVKAGVHVFTNIEFLQGGVKVFETSQVEATAVNVPSRGAVAFQFTVPLAALKDGLYTCQVNIIDDTGAAFAFPRTALSVRSSKP